MHTQDVYTICIYIYTYTVYIYIYVYIDSIDIYIYIHIIIYMYLNIYTPQDPGELRLPGAASQLQAPGLRRRGPRRAGARQ